MARLSSAARKALIQNTTYTKNIKSMLGKVPKNILAITAAEVLATSIKETHRDSSRAAANWNISFGAYMPGRGMNPEKYGGLVNGKGAIGHRGDKGSTLSAEQLIAYKAMHYGFDPSSYEPTGGTMNRKLHLNKGGPPPQVIVYNPIKIPQYQVAAFSGVSLSPDRAASPSQGGGSGGGSVGGSIMTAVSSIFNLLRIGFKTGRDML